MLNLLIPGGEAYDEVNNLFINTPSVTIRLEHSLVSLALWESKWEKPFISKTPKSRLETEDYLRMMTLDENVDPNIYSFITSTESDKINRYIDSKMTATILRDSSKKTQSKEAITAELLYYWMIVLNIPFECQTWHLNRLITLIGVCNIKNNPQKMSKREIFEQNAALNAKRKAELNSRG